MLDRVSRVFKCLLLLAALLSVQAQPLSDFKHPLWIELSIATDSLNGPLFRRNGWFRVHAKITNISNRDQMITVWAPGGGCWISDSAMISTEVNTLVTGKPMKKLLKPGQTYADDNDVIWYPRTQSSTIFKLGLFPAAESRESCKRDTIPRDQIVWSNAVTLTQ